MTKVSFTNQTETVVKYKDYPELKEINNPVVKILYREEDGEHYIEPIGEAAIFIQDEPERQIIIRHAEPKTGYLVIS